MRRPSAAVTRALAKLSNWSGCRCSASQMRKAASATGSVVPCANARSASLKRMGGEVEKRQQLAARDLRQFHGGLLRRLDALRHHLVQRAAAASSWALAST